MESRTLCRTCGLDTGDFVWSEDCQTPMFLICDCCGTESGYEDVTEEAARGHLLKWIEEGCLWHKPASRPSYWDLRKQILLSGIDPQGLF